MNDSDLPDPEASPSRAWDGILIDLSYLPDPDIVLCGCRPLVPYRGYRDPEASDNYPPFHVAGDPPKKGKLGPLFPQDSLCPACHGAIQRDNSDLLDPTWIDPDDSRRFVECECCGSVADQVGAQVQRRVAALRFVEDCADRHRDQLGVVEKLLAAELVKAMRRAHQDGGPLFTPMQVLRLWYGSRESLIPDELEISNRAKAGRDFLRRIGIVVSDGQIYQLERETENHWANRVA